MVVTVTMMRVVQVIPHEVVNMIAVWNRLVPAVRPVDVALLVASALMTGRATHRIDSANFDLVLLHATSSDSLQMTVLQVVDVIIMFHGFVPAGRTMDVGYWCFLDGGLVHGISPLCLWLTRFSCKQLILHRVS